MAYVLAVAGAIASWKFAMALAGGMALGGTIVLYPFIGLALVTFSVQADALASVIFRGLPVSGPEFLTMFTLAGVAFNTYREPRRDRLGTDELALRFAFLFCITMILALFFVADRDLANESLRRLASLAILLYLVVRIVRTPEQVETLLLCIVASTLLCGSVLLVDILRGQSLVSAESAAQWQDVSRYRGASDYNPTAVAAMLLTGTALAAVMFLELDRFRLLTGLTTLVGSAAVVFSFARSGFLLYLVALAWLGFKYRRHRRFPLVFLLALAALCTAALLIPADYWERMRTLLDFDTDQTLWRRLGYHLIGIDLLLDNPLLGVGPGNFPHYYLDAEYRWIPGRTWEPRRLHNMYLEVAVEFGLLGIAFFAGMLITALRGLVIASRHAAPRLAALADALKLALVVYLMASVFLPTAYNKYTWLLPGIAVALARLARLEQGSNVDSRAEDSTMRLSAPKQ